jgi:hypothetical protein
MTYDGDSGVIVEQLVERRLAGETEVLGEKLPQRHFVHHKFHMTRPGLEPGPKRWEDSLLAGLYYSTSKTETCSSETSVRV